jgi:hypothetical protein
MLSKRSLNLIKSLTLPLELMGAELIDKCA